MLSNEVNPMSTTYTTLRNAILNQQQVVLEYQGYRREVCPHVIGLKNGKQHVLTYQFAGGSKSGLPPLGQWRCIDVRSARIVEVRDGPWRTGDSHTRPQTCVDQIDVQWTGTSPTPYAQRA